MSEVEGEVELQASLKFICVWLWGLCFSKEEYVFYESVNLLADLSQFDVFHCFLTLQPGDEVEFVVVQNQKSRKMSACSLRKMWLVQPWDFLLTV